MNVGLIGRHGKDTCSNGRRSLSAVRPVLAAVLAIAVAVSLAGCYWTVDESAEGGLRLEIAMPPEGIVSAGSLNDPHGFLLVYVIEETVLLGGPDAVGQLFDQLEAELDRLDEELDTIEFTSEADFQRFLDSFRVEVEFPSAQFRGQFINYKAGASGRSTFRGLNAGSRYLVVVEAYGEDESSGMEMYSIGFTRTTVRAGETRAVPIPMGGEEEKQRFLDFLRDTYGYPPTGPDDLEATWVHQADAVFDYAPSRPHDDTDADTIIMEFGSDSSFEIIFYRDGEQIDGSRGTVTISGDFVVFDVAEIWSPDIWNWVTAGEGIGPDGPVSVPFEFVNEVLTITLEESVVIPFGAMEFGVREELVEYWHEDLEPHGTLNIQNNGRYFYSYYTPESFQETGSWDASTTLFRNTAEDRNGDAVSIGYIGVYEFDPLGEPPSLTITYGVGVDAEDFIYTLAW